MVTDGVRLPLGRQSLLLLTHRCTRGLIFPFSDHCVARLKMNSAPSPADFTETETFEDS